MKLEYRSFTLDSKKVTGDATFSGWGNVAGLIDSDREVFDAHAFAADLKTRGSRRPVLVFHDPSRPVGYVDVQNTDKGIYGQFTLIDGVPDADVAKKLISAKVLQEL